MSKDLDGFVSLQGHGDGVGARGLDVSHVRDFPEFEHVGGALGSPYNLVDPLWWAGLPGFLLADPFTC
jgi:hypothetical protein